MKWRDLCVIMLLILMTIEAIAWVLVIIIIATVD